MLFFVKPILFWKKFENVWISKDILIFKLFLKCSEVSFYVTDH